MSRILAGVLAGCLILAVAGVAGAGIPDPDLSTIVLDPVQTNAGLMTCWKGDAPPFEMIKVTAKRTDTTPIEGIPYTSFFFTVVGGSVTITCESVPAETDVNGEILFSIVANEAIAHPLGDPAVGTPLDIDVQIYTVALTNGVSLTCNTVDYNLDDAVDPIDFVKFAADFNKSTPETERSDFDWSGGTIDPIDFVKFAAHFGPH
jgi:hypothetical protein